MSTADARMWQLVEDAAVAVTDDLTGRFENKRLVEEIRDRLADEDLMAHVREVSMERLAKSLAEGFVSRRNPKPGKPAGMFNPRAVLPLGDGIRVWMERATDGDLIKWALQSTKNLARVANAEGSRQEYVAERLDAFRDHSGWLLGRIEREVFGFAGDAESPDLDDSGDVEDGGGWDED